MISIIIPKNSLADLINAGMTHRYYAKKGEKVNINIINTEEKEDVWKNIKLYVDENGTLLILNFPLPSDLNILKNLKLEPYDYSILYLPSKMIPITPIYKKILLEKGIVTMPKRELYKCFPGEYADKIEKKWIEISKIISLADKPKDLNEEYIKIVNGVLKAAEKNPNLAIEKISNDDIDFFVNESQISHPEELEHIEGPDHEIITTDCKKEELIPLAFYHFLHHRKNLIGVKGIDSLLILTVAPTFAIRIIEDNGFNTEGLWKFGDKAGIFIDIKDESDMPFLVGRLSQRNIFIEFGYPKYVVKKTLTRRLIGGKGPGGRSYRGVKDYYPSIEINKNIISLPTIAFENVIHVFQETGTKYKVFT